MTICAIPGLIVGAIGGGLVAALGLPALGAATLVILAVVVAMWIWRGAPGMVLRAVGAQPSDEDERPRLHNLVDGLCASMGLPRPAVMVVDHPLPNALTVGRHPRSATLVVTSALDESLSLVELEGVLAHELVHIKRHDTVCSGVAVAVVAPLAAVSGSGAGLVHVLVGPGREFAADQRAVSVVRCWAGLGSALGAMTASSTAQTPQPPWPPGRGRRAALTRWLWINPVVGAGPDRPIEGNLDDVEVRAAALLLR